MEFVNIAQWEENDSVLSKETIIELTNKNIELQQKIDKAIKHIETHQLCYQSQYEEMSGFDNHLLDILRGNDEPKYLGYSDKECINCGRERVEKYSDGTEICEKCNFDQNKKEYV